MAKLFFATDYFTIHDVDKQKEKSSFAPMYMKMRENMRPGDFAQLTIEFEKSRMVYDGKGFQDLPLGEDFFVHSLYSFDYFSEYVDVVPFNQRDFNLNITYTKDYAVAVDGDVKILYILKTMKRINFSKIDIYYTYGQDVLFEELEGVDINQLIGAGFLFKII